MPYRDAPPKDRCSYCGDPSHVKCRLCQRRLCVRHALVTATFYVPVAECSRTTLGGECTSPRRLLRRQAHRSAALLRRVMGRTDMKDDT